MPIGVYPDNIVEVVPFSDKMRSPIRGIGCMVVRSGKASNIEGDAMLIGASYSIGGENREKDILGAKLLHVNWGQPFPEAQKSIGTSG